METRNRKEVLTNKSKLWSYGKEINEQMVLNSWQKVKANGGSAGVDNKTIEDFGKREEKNLKKLLRRMASGSYLPSPIKAVDIPKSGGGKRRLGIPTVLDRVAQMVVTKHLEPRLEKVFHKDSYAYRPNRSAKQAVGKVRERCWKYDWVLELDIKGLFDNIDHELLMKAVKHHAKEKWVFLYIERWIKAPLIKEGKVIERTKGIPQGGVISPLLANLFLHYAFDKCLEREHADKPFVRYADDAVIHCGTKEQAVKLKAELERRLKEVGLELNEKKTRIIYCWKSIRKKRPKEKHSFDFLGFTFCPRIAVSREGKRYWNFLPAMSIKERTRINNLIRTWRIRRMTNTSLETIARKLNPRLRGWYNYYGSFYPSKMKYLWFIVNGMLAKWARNTLKRFKGSFRRAYKWLKTKAWENPNLFYHWKLVKP